MQTHIRNNLVKTKYQNVILLRRYVNLRVFKFKNSKWPPFLHFKRNIKTVDTLRTGAEFDKEPFGEN